jgi:hypothetical protein
MIISNQLLRINFAPHAYSLLSFLGQSGGPKLLLVYVGQLKSGWPIVVRDTRSTIETFCCSTNVHQILVVTRHCSEITYGFTRVSCFNVYKEIHYLSGRISLYSVRVILELTGSRYQYQATISHCRRVIPGILYKSINGKHLRHSLNQSFSQSSQSKG